MATELFFGCGAAEETGKKILELGASRVIVVTDKGVVKNGVFVPVEKSLENSKIPFILFDEVEPEPTIQGVAKATQMCMEFGADIVIGLGGGSAMDSAKAVSVMSKNEGQILDYVGFGLVKNHPLPIIAIPTTAGTGSEVTYWSVLADKTNDVKTSAGGWEFMPTLAIVDPSLTKTLPPMLTAATGMDALCHAMESYVCTNTQPISEGLAIQAMKMISGAIRTAVNEGGDLKAREEMLMGSLVAAMAFNITRLGLAHALAIPLGAHFHIPHGTVIAILLPWVAEYNYPAAPEKYAYVAKILGADIAGLTTEQAAAKASEQLKLMVKDIGITEGLAKWGVTSDKLEMIAKEAITSKNVAVNPRSADISDLIKICENAMYGIEKGE